MTNGLSDFKRGISDFSDEIFGQYSGNVPPELKIEISKIWSLFHGATGKEGDEQERVITEINGRIAAVRATAQERIRSMTFGNIVLAAKFTIGDEVFVEKSYPAKVLGFSRGHEGQILIKISSPLKSRITSNAPSLLQRKLDLEGDALEAYEKACARAVLLDDFCEKIEDTNNLNDMIFTAFKVKILEDKISTCASELVDVFPNLVHAECILRLQEIIRAKSRKAKGKIVSKMRSPVALREDFMEIFAKSLVEYVSEAKQDIWVQTRQLEQESKRQIK